ncbi:hypothetical protein DM860_003907 [Cuscuta australis]|uniref:DUF7851 domain-containing protein n=1 Tax=Cuscuta australis TaxID=267555 RepID=A0A328CUZ8_9ASTE|nr:hypothetical protein DM860_003907 [Cuscuta australis]
MAEEDDKQAKKKKKNKKQKHQHPNDQSAKSSSDFAFKPCSEVKGLRFGGQFIVKSFTVRRARPPELLRLLDLPPAPPSANPAFRSTTAFMPTNFTILAHKAWHTITLGLGTKKTKVVIFVFDSEGMKSAVDRRWPPEIALGEVNKKLIRGLRDCELARFKFRKGCITFYIYAVRSVGNLGFSSAEDLRMVLESTVELKDFLDHTEMLAMPSQKSIKHAAPPPPVAMAH